MLFIENCLCGYSSSSTLQFYNSYIFTPITLLIPLSNVMVSPILLFRPQAKFIIPRCCLSLFVSSTSQCYIFTIVSHINLLHPVYNALKPKCSLPFSFFIRSLMLSSMIFSRINLLRPASKRITPICSLSLILLITLLCYFTIYSLPLIVFVHYPMLPFEKCCMLNRNV